MPGSRPLTGWGVEVTLPGADRSLPESWTLLTKPERPEEPLCTGYKRALEWVDDYARRGCGARLKELKEVPRGTSYRSRRHVEDDLEKKTGVLPGLDAGLRDRVK